MKKQRLSKVLAATGVASRRKCEDLIFAGKVKVNNEVVLLPQTMVDIDTDEILVNGKPVSGVEGKVYFLLNKPVGFVCSNNPGSKAKNVLSLLDGVTERLFTVGRLDKDTQGLLLVTNDGHFANKVIHPSNNISKEYLAKTDKEISHEHLVAIGNGTIVEGIFVKPLKVSKVRRGTIKITIAEGKKREVRILLESVGLTVQELTRIRIGGLHLGKLPVGGYRELTSKDIDLIFEKNA